MHRFLLTIVTALAVAGPGHAAAQELRGMVWNEESGEPVALAVVRLLNGAYQTVDSVFSDDTGRFRFGLPDATTYYYLAVEADGYNSIVETVQAMEASVLLSLKSLDPDVDVRETTAAPASRNPAESDPNASDLLGQVIDGQTRRPIEGAEVSVLPAGLSALTDSEGYFSIRNVPVGLQEVTVSHVAFESRTTSFRMRRDDAYYADVMLNVDPVEVAGFDISVQGRGWARQLDDVRSRMARNIGGTYLSRLDFDRAGNPELSQVMRSLPGVTLRREGFVGRDWWVQFRGCRGTPAVYVDGTQIIRGSFSAQPIELDLVPSGDIEVVEIHKGLATLPPEFHGPGVFCGAIAIWTRHHEPGRRR